MNRDLYRGTYLCFSRPFLQVLKQQQQNEEEPKPPINELWLFLLRTRTKQFSNKDTKQQVQDATTKTIFTVRSITKYSNQLQAKTKQTDEKRTPKAFQVLGIHKPTCTLGLSSNTSYKLRRPKPTVTIIASHKELRIYLAQRRSFQGSCGAQTRTVVIDSSFRDCWQRT